MESTVKINRIATVSFVSGLTLIALLCFGLYWLLFPFSPGYSKAHSHSPRIFCHSSISLCVIGVIDRRSCAQGHQEKGGTEKGKIFAWVGILTGAGYVAFGLLVFIIFSAQFRT